jgi:hypothetical protein
MTKSDRGKGKTGSSNSKLRKWIENQVAFRSTNEKIKKNFDALAKLAKQDGLRSFAYHRNSKLYYICECSDENCRERIKLLQSTYDKIHMQRNRFVIVAGHEATEVEKVVERHAHYSVVEKYVTPPEEVEGLHRTSVSNT